MSIESTGVIDVTAAQDLVTLRNESWEVGVLPGTGGSLAFGRIRVGSDWLDLLRPTAEAEYGRVEATASFPLIPWSNRVRDGRLLLEDGREVQLHRNAGDGTAIHGIARNHGWTVALQDATEVVLTFDSSRVGDDSGWPFPFLAELRYRLEGERLIVETTVTNNGDEPMPAGMGHHPYFVRGLGAISDEVELQVAARRSYRLESAMATAAAGQIAPRLDFRASRRLGSDFIDDLLTERAETGPAAVLTYPVSGVTVTMEADADYRHVVVYVPQHGKDFFAVEPATNANDGFTLAAKGIPGHGVQVIAPGQSWSLRWSLTVER